MTQSFQFLMDESGQEYVSMTCDKATKNLPGGIDDISSVFDGFNCLKVLALANFMCFGGEKWKWKKYSVKLNENNTHYSVFSE